jgi:hypothetical protein
MIARDMGDCRSAEQSHGVIEFLFKKTDRPRNARFTTR